MTSEYGDETGSIMASLLGFSLPGKDMRADIWIVFFSKFFSHYLKIVYNFPIVVAGRPLK
jgi:hypothetical protein